MLNKFGLGIILLVLVMFAGVSVKAAVFTVDNTTDNGALTACTAAANDCSLRGAITAANNSPANDTINFDAGVFGSAQTITLGGTELLIANAGTLTINGTGANNLTISGNSLSRVLHISPSGTLTIDAMKIANGQVTGVDGGGILNESGNLIITNSIITNNTSLMGGGGGGIGSLNGGTLNVIGTSISGNSTSGGNGGGILHAGTINIINSTISNNSTGVSGGAIYNIANTSVINSTISGNTAGSVRGGAIRNQGSPLKIINSTITNNNGPEGGGIYNDGSPVTMGNSILAGNSSPNGPDFVGTLTSQGYNLIGNTTNTTISGTTTGNILNVNAQLATLANNGGPTQTHALQSNSPAINAGNNALAVDLNNNPLTTDQRGTGFSRIRSGIVDMGAFEAILPVANTTTTITNHTPDPSTEGQSVTVSYTVAVITPATGVATGNVTISDGVNSCTGTVAAGQCSLTLNTLGNRTLTATYAGNMDFNSSVSAGEPHQVIAGSPLVLVVDNTSDNAALSACTAAANDCSLRGAISRANAVSTNDTINFDSSVFNVARTIIVSNGELAVTNNGGLVINGTGANLLNISGGGGSSRVFRFNTVSPVVLNSLTVSGGNSLDGGGIYNDSTPLTINNCNISGNGATSFGGGIYNVNGRVDINSSTISGNTAGGSGGGIANGGNPSVLNISNSTISGNTSNGTGGGGIFTNGQVNVYNSTIAANTANGNGASTGIGGGISNFTLEAVSLGNTIVAGNNAPNAPDFRDTLTSLGYNLIGSTSGTNIVGNTDGNQLNVNPLLGSLANNGGPTQTHLLAPNSPAINAGNNFLALDTNNQPLTNDQRGMGFNRIVGTVVDIGAYENNLPVVTENPQSQTVPAGSSVTFTARGGVFSQTAPSSLSGGQALMPGQFLISPNFGYQLIYQTDGNLVLYRGDGVVLKNFNTQTANPGQAIMQGDGNFVIVDGNNNVQFATGTNNNPGATLTVQADGNVVVYSQGGSSLYSTGTSFTGANPIPSVQWQISTDGGMNFTNLSNSLINVSGATTPILTFIAEMSDNGNLYRAVFTNTFGAVASVPAVLNVMAPTAAGVSVSGRVLTNDGRGLMNTTVIITDQNGQTQTARTSSFGYYRFEDVGVGQTNVIQVRSKNYSFAPQIISVNDNLTEVNFTALE